MNFRILVPFWGNDIRYIKQLGQWFAAYRAAHIRHPVSIISDTYMALDEFPQVNFCDSAVWQAFPVPARNEYAFDHKGEIVCAAIQSTEEPVLVLDADALIQHDPEPFLEGLEHTPFAMPRDEANLKNFIRNRHAMHTTMPKLCAGVLWFGRGGNRKHLVAEYRRAFKELETGKYYEERRLFEQHAWTMVAHWTGAPILDRCLNWADHITSIGPNPKAAIYHRIGQRKLGKV
jgi:hypothetical protein